MEIMLIIFATIGMLGLILKIIGVCINNESLCVYGSWCSSAASGNLIGFAICILFGGAHVMSDVEYEKIHQPPEKVYVDRCWTIFDKEYCGNFIYENEHIKIIGHENSGTNIELKMK